jgi:hypothetical protein
MVSLGFPEARAMEVLPIDLTAIIAVIMGCSVVLIPIIGLTARFALKPTVEALSRVFEKRGMDESVQILERRVALLETELDSLQTAMNRLEEVSSFDHQLRDASNEPMSQLPDGTSER